MGRSTAGFNSGIQANAGLMRLTCQGSYADASCICMLHLLPLDAAKGTPNLFLPPTPQQYPPGLPADAGFPLGSVGIPGGGSSAATSCLLPCLVPFLGLAPTASPAALPPAGSELAGPAERRTSSTLAGWRDCLDLPCWPLGAAESVVAPRLPASMSAPAPAAAASAAGPLPAASRPLPAFPLPAAGRLLAGAAESAVAPPLLAPTLAPALAGAASAAGPLPPASRPLPAFPLPAATWLSAGPVAEALAEGCLPLLALPAEGWRPAGASVLLLPFFLLPGPLSKPGGALLSFVCCSKGWSACACSVESCLTPCRCRGVG